GARIASAQQRRPAVDGAAQRINRAAPPGNMRCYGQRPSAENGVADTGVGALLIGRDNHLVAADADDLAPVRAVLAAMLDHIAEARYAGQALDGVVCRGNLGDQASAPDCRLVVLEAAPQP